MHFRLLFSCILLMLASPAYAEPVVITTVGDVMPAGSALQVLRKRGYDYLFSAVADELKRGDIVVGNLEAPMARGGTEFTGKKYRFRMDPEVGRALKNAGFTVLTLANNHMMDFGASALLETLQHLDRNGISHAGAGIDLSEARKPAIVAMKGKKFAFLAYSLTFPKDFYATAASPGTAPGYPSYIKEDIRNARRDADHVIVSLHWGTEGSPVPSPYQKNLARTAIDAGADLVLGHHPHVLQGIETYRDGLIIYSLGNFAFGSLSPTAKRSAIIRITFDDGLKEAELIPLNVDNRQVRFQPRILSGQAAGELVSHMNRISEGMGTEILSQGERFLLSGKVSTRIAQE